MMNGHRYMSLLLWLHTCINNGQLAGAAYYC